MKRKVLFVVHQLNVGGVQKALLTVLDALDYEQNDVTVYVRKARLDLLPEVNPHVSRVIVNDDKAHDYRTPYAVWMTVRLKWADIFRQSRKRAAIQERLNAYIAEKRMKREVKKYFSDGETYDVAVSYIQGYPALLVADYVNAKRKIMFYHVSTDEYHALHESVFDTFDAIVGVNEGVQKVLQGLYPAWKDKITYLDNHTDAEKVRAAAQTVVDTPREKMILCSCGRFTSEKGFDMAVDAARILHDGGLPFAWYFIGDGSERAALEQSIRAYGLTEHVVLTGMQANPYPWMNACDIYVQPSRKESYGLSMLEAQILQKPVVTTATVGGKTLVKNGETGLVCGIDGASIAASVQQLAQDSALRQAMQNNLEKIDYAQDTERYRTAWATLLKG